MAEQSFLWTTSSSGDGAATYTRTDWSNIMEVIAACHAFEGFAPNYNEAVAPFPNGANSIQVGTGGAVVDGKPYMNTARVNVSIPSSSGAGLYRQDWITLRADWTAQTVRVTRIAGTEGVNPAISTTPPAQTRGSLFDVLIAITTVDSNGNVTITDWRRIAQPLLWRQGGDASNWFIEGSTSYVPGRYAIEAGIGKIIIPNGSTGTETSIAFKNGFLNSPIIFLTPHAVVGPTDDVPKAIVYRWAVNQGYATSFTVHASRPSTNTPTGDMPVWFSWMAIGPV